MERKNVWKDYAKTELDELEKLCKEYRKFLDEGKTERECVKYLVKMAEEFGYENESKFSAAFKRIMGDTPGVYRKEHTKVKII